MAKWKADLPGSSGHVHQSLWAKGKSAFYDPKAAHGMSSTLRHYLAGQIELMREFTALVSPTINSYKRYVPGVWAPLRPCWGLENRTAALRVIGAGDPQAIRVEHRQPAADMNPYVAIAAALGAGLYGVEHELDLEPAVAGDAGQGSAAERLPRTLKEATALLAQSSAARELFGEAFVDHYVRTREWEVARFERAVTDWELQRYFEII
jgi:glutamine synthetase